MNDGLGTYKRQLERIVMRPDVQSWEAARLPLDMEPTRFARLPLDKRRELLEAAVGLTFEFASITHLLRVRVANPNMPLLYTTGRLDRVVTDKWTGGPLAWFDTPVGGYFVSDIADVRGIREEEQQS